MLQRIFCSSCLLVGLLSCSTGNNDEPEAIKTSVVQAMERLTAVFSTVKDLESARQAKPELLRLSDEINRLRRRMETMRKPADADRARYGAEIGEVAKKMSAEVVRVAMLPNIGTVLDDLFQKMELKIQKVEAPPPGAASTSAAPGGATESRPPDQHR